MSPIPDERLRLIFTCCHPALAPEARVALTLRLLGGLTTAEVARAFLVSEPAMAQRLVRAKAQDPRPPASAYEVPRDADLPARLGSVLATLYLIFNEGYAATPATRWSARAVRRGDPARAACSCALMPDEPEALGAAGADAAARLAPRRRASDADGELVLLADQDRARWDRAAIAEGARADRARAARSATAAATRCRRRSPPSTPRADRRRHRLGARSPRSTTGSRAIDAVAGGRAQPRGGGRDGDGPAAGAGARSDELAERSTRYHLFHAARADLLRRLGPPRRGGGRLRARARAGRQPRRARRSCRERLAELERTAGR